MSTPISFENLRRLYESRLDGHSSVGPQAFPSAPAESLSASGFVSALIAKAAETDPRASHPFLRNVAGGRYGVEQLQEWVRQDYQAVLGAIRRHSVLAACAADCDQLRSLLSYVSIEADADPVSGTFFSLPQLWVKFGIALGLAREQLIHAQPGCQLSEWQIEAMNAARKQSAVPVSLLVNTLLDPVLAAALGKRLISKLSIPRESLDYFWAIAGNRWGENIGWPILEAWSGAAAQQAELWNRYAAELAASREAERLTLLQQAVESASGHKA